MDWKEKALKTLRDSLLPVPTELNELDWKSGLSSKTERLAQHISAFANLQGGGILVFGVNNDGSLFSVLKQETDSIVQLLGNIAKNNSFVASRIIADTVEAGLIMLSDENFSKNLPHTFPTMDNLFICRENPMCSYISNNQFVFICRENPMNKMICTFSNDFSTEKSYLIEDNSRLRKLKVSLLKSKSRFYATP